jgi:hypothetical protein
MTRKLLLYFFIVCANVLFAQNHSNSWINFNQKYFKFPVNKEGIYRIDRDALVNLDAEFASINPKNLQVFSRGEEQHIYVRGENDFTFDSGDYIEFYAKPNDAWLDTGMFANSNFLANSNYSYINDTIYYFLTWEVSPTQKLRLSFNTDTAFTSYNQLDYCKKTIINQYNNSYYYGASDPRYTIGEGWFDSNAFVVGSIVTKTVEIKNYTNDEDVKIKAVVVGAPATQVVSILPHQLKIDFDGTNYIDTQFVGYDIVRPEFILPISSVLSENINLKFSANHPGTTVDREVISYIETEYSHDFDFENANSFNFVLQQTIDNKNAVEISNFSVDSVIIYNLTNNSIISSYSQSNNIKFVAGNGLTKRQMFVIDANSVNNITNVSKVSFTDYSSTGINSDLIIISNKTLMTKANEYANYKNSKGFNSLVVDVDELYEQFSYGINKHPLAIRYFMEYFSSVCNEKPKGLLLIGKSLHARLYRKTIENYESTLVPSYGNPASDNLFTINIKNSGIITPFVPVGRISAKDNTEVGIYLDKLIEYNITILAEWRKNAIHFGGGSTTSEQTTFASYLHNYENILADTLFGGFTHTFLKTNSAPIQITQTDSIRELINRGVSILTFFGHGSSSGFDQNIDEPSAYNNKGRFPFMMVSSCLTGDIHISPTGETPSEQWVLIKYKGVIGYFATVDIGYASYLNILSTEMYKNISYKNYGNSVGEIIKNSFRTLEDSYASSKYVQVTCLESILHGDPTLILNSATKPDLKITESDISFSPGVLTTEIDSFYVNFVITNIGRATLDTFVLEITRTFADGSDTIVAVNVQGCLYKDTISIKFPVNKIKGTELNTFCAKVDALLQIDEFDETNNSACNYINITSTNLAPIWPYKYAIYPNDTVTLKASTGDPFINIQTSVIQIDTVDTYDSPFKTETQITHGGGVIQWHLPFTLTENKVYYWRVAKQGTSDWAESSFIYISGQTGWSQAHFFQFKNDTYKFIDYNRPNRKFDFLTSPKKILCHNIGSPSESETYKIKYFVESNGDYGTCGAGATMAIAVIDSSSLVPWTSDIADYGHKDYPKCYSRTRIDKYFLFKADSLGFENLADFMSSLPDGVHIIIYNIWNGNFQQWPERLYNEFENLYFATSVRFIPDNFPFIFYIQKGKPSSAIEVIGSSANDIIDLDKDIIVDFNYGNITSEIAGPSINWDKAKWQWDYNEMPNFDTTSLKIYGLDIDGNQNLFIDTIQTNNSEMLNLNNIIDANQYPYIKYEIHTDDEVNRTPSQIKKWQLMYDMVPETAINPESGFVFYNDTLQEGDDLVFAVATKNVSAYDMDSLLIKYYLKDKNNNISLLKTKRCRPHPSADILLDTISINTSGLPGLNSIWIEVNPVNDATGHYDQLEQYHFNNIAQKYFYVIQDNENPLLDVTFSGMHILDGDLVSAKPEILISLKDENKFLELNNPDVFKVYLKSPYNTDEILIAETDSLGNQQLYWTPAQLPNNSCKLMFTPNTLPDGIYQLRVSAVDITGNESGKYDYIVSFTVENKSTITDIFNYPNPFSTSTRWVFTLSGSTLPDEFSIEIMTISGKLVKVITLDELGQIRIGRNITDYSWDGTDMYGDRLANGVYFYRVRTKINGENIDKRDTGSDTDKYFKKGWGKLYIMR